MSRQPSSTRISVRGSDDSTSLTCSEQPPNPLTARATPHDVLISEVSRKVGPSLGSGESSCASPLIWPINFVRAGRSSAPTTPFDTSRITTSEMQRPTPHGRRTQRGSPSVDAAWLPGPAASSGRGRRVLVAPITFAPSCFNTSPPNAARLSRPPLGSQPRYSEGSSSEPLWAPEGGSCCPSSFACRTRETGGILLGSPRNRRRAV